MSSAPRPGCWRCSLSWPQQMRELESRQVQFFFFGTEFLVFGFCFFLFFVFGFWFLVFCFFGFLVWGVCFFCFFLFFWFFCKGFILVFYCGFLVIL